MGKESGTVMQRRDFQDPARLLEQREARTCRGCAHLINEPLFDLRYVTCRKDGAKHWPSGWRSRRCKRYETPSTSCVYLRPIGK